MRDSLTRIGFVDPLVAHERMEEGLDSLPVGAPLAAKGSVPLDGPALASEVVKRFTADEARLRKLTRLNPKIRGEIVSRLFPEISPVVPPRPLKLTPRKPYIPASGSLIFRNASLVAAHSDTASFGWMYNVADDLLPAMPNDDSSVDIWVSPDAVGLVLVLVQVVDSPKYLFHRSFPPDPGAMYTVTGFDGVTRTEMMTGNPKIFPFIFTATDFSWRRCRVAGMGWPWRFWSAEVMYPNASP